METLPTKGVCFSFPEMKKPKTSLFVKVEHKLYKHQTPKLRTFCACDYFSSKPLKTNQNYQNTLQNVDLPPIQPSNRKTISSQPLKTKQNYENTLQNMDLPPIQPSNKKKLPSQPLITKQNYESTLQNVDLPHIQPKNKKKPFVVPIKKMLQESRKDKMLARQGIEKTLEAPKNGLLVPELVPVAHLVLENWKVLIKGLSQLLTVVSVYGCSKCSEIHVGPAGHEIQDCRGTGSERRNSFHCWVKGSVNDVLIPIESYHLFDPFGKRVKHETRFAYDRIPAVVELCIQAGVDLPEYPSRRRTEPIRMMGKKVIYRGGFVEEPKGCKAEDRTSVLYELDTYGLQTDPEPPTDLKQTAETTLRAYRTVRGGVRKLMKHYSVKACGYCPEIHVGPWGHDVKMCGAFKHQWRDGKHGWQDATLDEVVPPNYVWHVKDPNAPLKTGLKRYYGKAPAVVELCVQAGADIPSNYRPMMRLDIIVPDSEEARLVA